MLTAEDSIKAAKILMQPGVYEVCQGVVKGRPLKKVGEQCLEKRERIDSFFNWGFTATALCKFGVEVRDTYFSEYYDRGHNSIFFESMFKALSNPVAKPLEEWL